MIECRFGQFAPNRVPTIEGRGIRTISRRSPDQCKHLCASENRCRSFSSCCPTSAGCSPNRRNCHLKDRKLFGNEETEHKPTCQTFFLIDQGEIYDSLF